MACSCHALDPRRTAPPLTGSAGRGQGRSVPDVLAFTLELAVPLRIIELRGARGEERYRLAREAADVIAAHGDDILFRSPRRGGTARATAALITGLACAAFQPGGVRFGPLAWCAAHPGHRWADNELLCGACLAAETAAAGDRDPGRG